MNTLLPSFQANINTLILITCTVLHIFKKCRLMDWRKLSWCFREKKQGNHPLTLYYLNTARLTFSLNEIYRRRMPGRPMMAQTALNSCLLNFYFSGMADQMITVYNTSGDTTSVIKYHEGFMGQRVAKVSCLAFHPHLVSKATASIVINLDKFKLIYICAKTIVKSAITFCLRLHHWFFPSRHRKGLKLWFSFQTPLTYTSDNHHIMYCLL